MCLLALNGALYSPPLSKELRDFSSMRAQMGTLLLGAKKREEGKGESEWQGKAARGKFRETVIYPFVEDTEQRAHRDALIHEAGLLQVRGQAHSHQLQQVGVPQLAAEAKKLQVRERERGQDETMGAFLSSGLPEYIPNKFYLHTVFC